MYIYGGEKSTIGSYMQRAMDKYSNLLEWVSDESDACLKVLSCDYMNIDQEPFQNFQPLLDHPGWNEGRNHFIWRSNWCFQDHEDFVFFADLNFQRRSYCSSCTTSEGGWFLFGHFQSRVRQVLDQKPGRCPSQCSRGSFATSGHGKSGSTKSLMLGSFRA